MKKINITRQPCVRFECEFHDEQCDDYCALCSGYTTELDTLLSKGFSPDKALRYNTGKLHWSLLDYSAIEDVIRVLEYGRHKYSSYKDSDGKIYKGVDITPQQVIDMNLTIEYDAKDNWKKPMPSIDILDSMQRHLTKLMKGELLDDESGLPHEAHICCNAIFYRYHINQSKYEKLYIPNI